LNDKYIMRLKEFNMIVETVAETQDILKLSTDIVDFIYLHKDRMTPGTVFSLSDMGITARTPAVQTIINATRIKIVDPKLFNVPGTSADAAPYYTTDKGKYNYPAYKDARTSREFNKGRMPGMTADEYPEFKDLISHEAGKGNKLDLRLNATILDFDKPGQLERVTNTLSHEFSHHLDTIKGRNNVATYEADLEAQKAQARLDQHNKAKEMLKNPRPGLEDVVPAGLLDPKEEKRLIGIVKRAPKSVPLAGGEFNKAYFAEVTEINARLTEASADLAEYIKGFKFYNNDDMKKTIEYFMTNHAITNCFVPFASEAEFQDSLKMRLAPSQVRQAYANPEFQKLYKRIWKFMDAEMAPGGIIKTAQQDGFKNWNKASQSLGGKTPKATFIEQFIQQVVKGIEAVKDVAKLALRHIADTELKQLLARELPKMLAKGALKSIPYVGILIGVVFGIERLIKGDVPGAGIELVAGVGSLATAIPATAYQAARDLYGEYYVYEGSGKPAVFEYDMAADPEGTKQRVADLAAKIEQELKAGLNQNQSRLTKAQGAANARNALRNYSTAGNPSPALNPELYPQPNANQAKGKAGAPAYESLDRIIELAVVKKPT
jgi:hypothetical protein